jgi:hypothetical protein
MATVARALHYAHERHVLHRDLKPSNILIDRDGTAYLTDFGLAKIVDNTVSLTLTRGAVGTPGYMAPEQVRGEEPRVAGDVWGLGATVYTLLTGKPPFQGVTDAETLQQTQEEEPVNPRRENEAIDVDLVTICLKCLEKDPAQRYVSAQAMAEDLERWLRNESIHARRPSVVRRTTRWVQRNPVGAGLIAALVVALGVSVELLVTLSRAKMEAEYSREAMKLQMNVDDFWKGDLPSMVIKSETMALLRSKTKPIAIGQPRYTIGLLVEEKPMNRAERFTDFLLYLEDRLAREGMNVRLDYVMYKRNRKRSRTS